ncbi:MAG: trypsin-like peptidase domain-containing protein [Bacteriovoracaceae bacterium]|nr:trypsin-like peptidase domain-containing protein [Bacteriovoracaceae bacterium]
MTFIFRFTFLCVLGLVVSCAKKVDKDIEDKNLRTPRNQTQIDPVIHRFFQEQELLCDTGACHPSVAKLVLFDRGALEFCSGVLVAPDVILTSSNCLTRNLKHPNISCLNNVFVIFPGSASMMQEKVRCDVVLSSNILEEDEDPALWRSDFAFLKLKSTPNRSYVSINRDGLELNKTYHQWKIDVDSERSATLKKSECKTLFDSYANPFSRQKYSPMITVSGCDYSEGNIGSPVFNDKGEVVALLSATMDQELRNYVLANDMLVEEIQPIQHVSNLACEDHAVSSSKSHRDSECNKRIDIVTLDKYRSRLLNSRKTHMQNMSWVESELEKEDKYFKWDVKFFSNKRGNTLEAHYGRPKCFFDVNSWVGEFSGGWRGRSIYTYGFIEVSHKSYLLETKLDSQLKPVSTLIEGEDKTYKVEFNPAGAFFDSITEVTISAPLQDFTSIQTYSNISDQCGE